MSVEVQVSQTQSTGMETRGRRAFYGFDTLEMENSKLTRDELLALWKKRVSSAEDNPHHV